MASSHKEFHRLTKYWCYYTVSLLIYLSLVLFDASSSSVEKMEVNFSQAFLSNSYLILEIWVMEIHTVFNIFMLQWDSNDKNNHN